MNHTPKRYFFFQLKLKIEVTVQKRATVFWKGKITLTCSHALWEWAQTKNLWILIPKLQRYYYQALSYLYWAHPQHFQVLQYELLPTSTLLKLQWMPWINVLQYIFLPQTVLLLEVWSTDVDKLLQRACCSTLLWEKLSNNVRWGWGWRKH